MGAKRGCPANNLAGEQTVVVGRVTGVPGKLVRGLVGNGALDAFTGQSLADLVGQYDSFGSSIMEYSLGK